MIKYSNIYKRDAEGKFLLFRRFHYFGAAQEACNQLDKLGEPYFLWLFDENDQGICSLRSMRVPRLDS